MCLLVIYILEPLQPYFLDAPPVDALMSSIDQMNLSESSVFELKREVFMQSSTHSQFGSGEPKVQIHGRATRTEQTSQKMGDKPAVQVVIFCSSEYWLHSPE